MGSKEDASLPRGRRYAGEISSLSGLPRQQCSQETVREESRATGKLLAEGSRLRAAGRRRGEDRLW